jgi:hypothetical protein
MLIHSTGIQPPLALYYGNFVNAAYEVYKAFPTNLNPSQSDYPHFPGEYQLVFNIQMSDFFNNDSTPKYYGFIAQSTTNSNAFVTALRGTETWEEWWDDFHWGLEPFPYMSNAGKVAAGFLDIYKTFSIMVPGSNAPMKSLQDKTELPGGVILSAQNVSLVAVGHSLGAGLITLYALDVASHGTLNPMVYTFASPRVGDKAFAHAYDTTVATNYRIWNWPDLVPNFPKDPFDNYKHVKGGFEVDSLDHPLTVKITVECFHALVTYLFLVGASASILGDCGV